MVRLLSKLKTLILGMLKRPLDGAKEGEQIEIVPSLAEAEKGESPMERVKELKREQDKEERERKREKPIETEAKESESLEEITKEIDTLRAEVNLLVYPFFALNNRDVRTRRQTEFRTKVQRGGEIVEISWIVSGDTRYGYPGPFDKEVHRAIEQIIQEMPLPIKNPITISAHEIWKKLGKKGKGGWQYRRIRESLKRIAAATITAEGTFYRKGKRTWGGGVFHLYDVYYKGSKLPDGSIAEKNYLFLNELYLESINSRYVKPIDFQYYQSLKNALAQRLYEILGVKFYGLRGTPYIRYRYSTLCQLIPLQPQEYLSKAKQIFAPAHKKLVDTGFIEEPWWEEIPNNKKDWIIYYRPGPRALEEIKRYSHSSQAGANQVQIEEAPQVQDQTQTEAVETPDSDSDLEGEWLARWRAMSPEEKAEYQLQRWLMMEEALHRHPTEEEIAAKREELIKYYSRGS